MSMVNYSDVWEAERQTSMPVFAEGRFSRLWEKIRREWRIARSNRRARKERYNWAWVNRYNPPRMCRLER